MTRDCAFCRRPTGTSIQVCAECIDHHDYRPIAHSTEGELCPAGCGHLRRNHDCWYPESGICGAGDCKCIIPGLPAPMQITPVE